MSQGITTDVTMTGPVQNMSIYDWGYYDIQGMFMFHIEETVNENDNTSTVTFTAFFKDGPNATLSTTTNFRGWFTGTVFYQVDGSATEVTIDNWSESLGNAGLPDPTMADSSGWRSIGSGGTDTMPWTPWSATVTIPHNADGTLSLKIGFKANGGTTPTLLLQRHDDPTAIAGNYNFDASATTSSITLTAIAQGKYVYIHNGTTFAKYRAYIRVNGAWVAADPYIWNGSAWVPCSS